MHLRAIVAHALIHDRAQAFADFDGCFALTCGTCKLGFCALCLANCGSDAHPHLAAAGVCPFYTTGGFHGTQQQLETARRTRRAWGLWQLLDDARGAFTLPAGRQLRQRLLDSVRKNVEDRDVLGVPIGHFMAEANRPRSLRTLAQGGRNAAIAQAAGGGQLIADPDDNNHAAAAAFAAQIANMWRPPVPPRPEPPKPLPSVYCAVIKKKKGEACKRCAGPLAQGAAALLHETHEPVFIACTITGGQMGIGMNKTTKGKEATVRLACAHPDLMHRVVRRVLPPAVLQEGAARRQGARAVL